MEELPYVTFQGYAEEDWGMEYRSQEGGSL
jgi:hypothetical protein